MEFARMMKLVDAGYTKDEINVLKEQEAAANAPKVDERVTRLQDAGFSEEEIKDLLKDAPEDKKDKKDKKDKDPEVLPNTTTATQEVDTLNKVLLSVNSAIEEMRAAAIRQTELPDTESAGDIMATIINPRHNEGSK